MAYAPKEPVHWAEDIDVNPPRLYQGPKGALGTALTAILLALFVLGTGSLWPAMVIHALIDLRVLPLTIAKPTP